MRQENVGARTREETTSGDKAIQQTTANALFPPPLQFTKNVHRADATAGYSAHFVQDDVADAVSEATPITADNVQPLCLPLRPECSVFALNDGKGGVLFLLEQQHRLVHAINVNLKLAVQPVHLFHHLQAGGVAGKQQQQQQQQQNQAQAQVEKSDAKLDNRSKKHRGQRI